MRARIVTLAKPLEAREQLFIFVPSSINGVRVLAMSRGAVLPMEVNLVLPPRPADLSTADLNEVAMVQAAAIAERLRPSSEAHIAGFCVAGLAALRVAQALGAAARGVALMDTGLLPHEARASNLWDLCLLPRRASTFGAFGTALEELERRRYHGALPWRSLGWAIDGLLAGGASRELIVGAAALREEFPDLLQGRPLVAFLKEWVGYVFTVMAKDPPEICGGVRLVVSGQHAGEASAPAAEWYRERWRPWIPDVEVRFVPFGHLEMLGERAVLSHVLG